MKPVVRKQRCAVAYPDPASLPLDDLVAGLQEALSGGGEDHLGRRARPVVAVDATACQPPRPRGRRALLVVEQPGIGPMLATGSPVRWHNRRTGPAPAGRAATTTAGGTGPGPGPHPTTDPPGPGPEGQKGRGAGL